jgi:simple sugar transport system substrate-binding protein
MKKSVFLSILILLSILIGSCAPAATPTAVAPDAGAPATEAPSGEEPLEIVMVAKAEGISWFDDMRTGVEQFGEDYGVNAYQIAPEGGDPAKQAQMVEDLIAKGVDAILVVPNDPKSMGPVLKKAKEKGIVVVSHEAQQLAPIVDYDMEAFKNDYFGEVMFEALAQAMGGDGKFTGFVGALTMETHMQWFTAGLKYIQENYPDMEFVSTEPYEDMNDEKISYEKFQEILKTYPDLEGAFGTSVSSTSMIGLVLKEKNNKNVMGVGLGLPSQTGPYITEGWIKHAQCWRPADAGYVTALIAYKILMGETVETGDNLEMPGYESVTVENKIVYGNAPLILTAETVDDYDF